MAYSLDLTEHDISVIHMVGGRYCWSSALLKHESGHRVICESEAWELADAFDLDMEGGHSMFPLLLPGCSLYLKLARFRDSIV